ncbi:uncharacterized protein GBIM_19387 [Gryllus bimaculatus]|nr:uncharacterized protein GBIM_19387 [Gryllus bimaculatus]
MKRPAIVGSAGRVVQDREHSGGGVRTVAAGGGQVAPGTRPEAAGVGRARPGAGGVPGQGWVRWVAALGPGPGPGASDEAAVFGQYVAEKLRGYSRRTRAVVEHLVSNVLFEADMGKHDAPPQLLAQERAAGGHRLRGGCGSPPLVVTYSAPSPSPLGSPSRGPLDEDDEDGGEGDAEDGGAAVKLEPELDGDFDDERGGL